MKLLRLIPSNTNIDFLSIKKFAFLFSILVISGTFLSLFLNNLNYGIDFKGGILLEVRAKNYEKNNINELRNKVLTLKAGETSIQKFGKEGDYLIRIQKQEGDQKQQIAMIEKVKLLIDNDYSIRRSEFVGPTVGDELKIAGIYAVSLSLLAIMVYIWFRFEWQFSVGAVAALIHDITLTIGIFSLLQIKFDLAIIAALLTIVGYSLNDTVVVFDRVRENLRKYKKLELQQVLNLSINETLSRTVMTSVTTLIALISLFILGGDVIRGFVFAMIWGVIVGTYSSVFIASNILLRLGVKRDWSKPSAGAGTKFSDIDA